MVGGSRIAHQSGQRVGAHERVAHLQPLEQQLRVLHVGEVAPALQPALRRRGGEAESELHRVDGQPLEVQLAVGDGLERGGARSCRIAAQQRQQALIRQVGRLGLLRLRQLRRQAVHVRLQRLRHKGRHRVHVLLVHLQRHAAHLQLQVLDAQHPSRLPRPHGKLKADRLGGEAQRGP